MFAALPVAAAIVLAPPPPAALVGHTALTGDDGTTTAHLLTVGFPLTEADRGFLTQIMNSDPYRDHFRHGAVFLRVGDRTVRGGPRLLGLPGTVAPARGLLGSTSRGRWSATFAVPGDLDPGRPLRFYFADVASRKPEPEPTAEPFATLRPTVADVKRVTTPPRAERVLAAALPPRQAEQTGAGYAAVFRLNFAAAAEFRVGDEKAVVFLDRVDRPDGSDPRQAWHEHATRPGEIGLGFKAKPPADAPLAFRVHGLPGWYTCETADAPKKK